LSLSGFQKLTHLWCDENEIKELDLSKVPRLTVLDCSGNLINVLDIRPLAQLKELTYDAKTTRLLQRPDQHF
jgi:Leucine-rich repeat (LRR) protein